MGSDRLEAYRITDFAVPMWIMDEDTISEAIYEDGADRNEIPNIVDEYWIGIRKGNYVFACFRVHQMSSVTWQIHARVLPEYRKDYSMRSAIMALKWCYDNIHKLRTIICLVPKCHRDVALFVRRVGFEYCGTVRQSYFKNNDLMNTEIFSINTDKIIELGD